MKNLLKLSFFLFALSAFVFTISCKKSNAKTVQFSTGTASITVDNITFTTNDTLGADFVNSGSDLTLWPTGDPTGKNLLFIFDIPTQSSGTVAIGAVSNNSTVVPSVTGYFVNGSASVHYASFAGSGSITKNSATSFTFSSTVVDQNNPLDSFTITGNGTY